MNYEYRARIQIVWMIAVFIKDIHQIKISISVTRIYVVEYLTIQDIKDEITVYAIKALMFCMSLIFNLNLLVTGSNLRFTKICRYQFTSAPNSFFFLKRIPHELGGLTACIHIFAIFSYDIGNVTYQYNVNNKRICYYYY